MTTICKWGFSFFEEANKYDGLHVAIWIVGAKHILVSFLALNSFALWFWHGQTQFRWAKLIWGWSATPLHLDRSKIIWGASFVDESFAVSPPPFKRLRPIVNFASLTFSDTTKKWGGCKRGRGVFRCYKWAWPLVGQFVGPSVWLCFGWMIIDPP